MARLELFKRCSANPLLTAEDWPYPINTVFNAAAAKLASAETLLLCRVEDRSGVSHFSAARSLDGKSEWKIDPCPTLEPDTENHAEESWGIEDPRAVWLPELEQYAVTYTCYSFAGPAVSLALTKDFKKFERVGNILPVENKDAALFPRRFDGRWAMLHRPVPSTVSNAHIWISFSPDLTHWGDHRIFITARGQPFWDGAKIGLSVPPIETPEGWLIIYHAARRTVSSTNYYLGLALADLQDPTKCIRRGDGWVFGPREHYERTGDVDNVVFPCGYTIAEDQDTIQLYYGAADTSIGLASGSIREMLDWLRHNSRADNRKA